MIESPTRQLADEHEYVKLVVGAMDAEVAYIGRTGRVHADRVAQMIDFTRNFTDGDHHAKEEELLFPLLEKRSAAAGGTVSVLLSEHEAARDCIRAIDAALPAAEHNEEARAVIAENLKLYAYLLPLHIGKEDTVLFPLADELLDMDDLRLLAAEFARVEAEEGSAAARERYHAMAHALATPPADQQTDRG
ncbi:MAG: hemerythrin domain-containing protein [Thermoleophilia bacterium]